MKNLKTMVLMFLVITSFTDATAGWRRAPVRNAIRKARTNNSSYYSKSSPSYNNGSYVRRRSYSRNGNYVYGQPVRNALRCGARALDGARIVLRDGVRMAVKTARRLGYIACEAGKMVIERTAEVARGAVVLLANGTRRALQVAGNVVVGTAQLAGDVLHGTAHVVGNVLHGTAHVAGNVLRGTGRVARRVIQGPVYYDHQPVYHNKGTVIANNSRYYPQETISAYSYNQQAQEVLPEQEVLQSVLVSQ